MPLTDLTEVPVGRPAQLRNEPVQARSAARLETLLDAAASVVDDLGYERLTTAMVAEHAGASIGTVYRYFPDRIAVLQALAGRNLDRVLGRIRADFFDERHQTWLEALSASFDIFVEAFRVEPGFRSLRVGDVLDLRPPLDPETFNSRVADEMMRALVERFDLEDTDESRFAFETAIEISDALVARAFARDPEGDPRFLEQARTIVRSVLSEHFGATTL
ncbi:TetR/AcrR family transcriptional regulator [Glaciihabitans sp. dw_435]|uniref:TetR/AcrR family transcriptional regulator n=1 Tax=Glaciihabitans sp. dw_435 TaxID=2720081 RepID=UPI001BD59376|nr:TetR/AcrR family transcriptional regulator [Glaciihabitans sp. dw_435]